MRIAICDDECIFIDKLKEYLYKYYDTQEVTIDTFKSGEELLDFYEKLNDYHDLIFLDIEMKKLNGIDTARKIRKVDKDVIIVFVTTHIECAIEGYEVDAYRFLAKPINENKLIEALNDINRELMNNEKILIKDWDKEVLIKVSDILYIEAQNNNISINTMEESYIIRRSLGNIESELKGDKFFKTHRSYIVNLSYVKTYDNKEITLENDKKIILSRTRVKDFKSSMLNYIRNNAR